MKNRIEEEIKKRAVDGKLSCPAARKIAEDLNVSYKEIGEAADRLKIKINNCALGCF
ncbi:MAG: hypothetical protein LLF28_01105 [Nitrospiraceae bacterium]|nr:hypothetical protein [Nitrospiraceae bacterium]